MGDAEFRNPVRRQRREIGAGKGDACPDVSFTRPEIARSVVLLPAPLAPNRPTASPSPISMLTSWIAGTEP